MSALTGLVERSKASVTLADGDVASSPPVPITSWESRDGRLMATVRFGPYAQRVEADNIVLTLDGGEERISLPGHISLPAGVRFTYELRVGVSRNAPA